MRCLLAKFFFPNIPACRLRALRTPAVIPRAKNCATLKWLFAKPYDCSQCFRVSCEKPASAPPLQDMTSPKAHASGYPSSTVSGERWRSSLVTKGFVCLCVCVCVCVCACVRLFVCVWNSFPPHSSLYLRGLSEFTLHVDGPSA